MFGSQNLVLSLRHPPFSVVSAPGACPDPIGSLKFPLHASALPRCPGSTQLLPAFSRPGRQGSHTNARDSFSLYALLPTSRRTPGKAYDQASSLRSTHPAPISISSATPFNATLTSPPANTHSKALTRKLNPLDTTFTENLGGGFGPRSLLSQPRYLFTSLRPYLKFAKLLPGQIP